MAGKYNILCALCLIMLCACNPTRTAFPDVNSIELKKETDKQRWEVAKKQWKKDQRHRKMMMEKQQRLFNVSDKIANAAIDMCTKVAVDSSDFCIYDFEVVNSRSINAWADGKKISITTAMMNFTKNDEDLAIVLGHEVAHNMMQHQSASTKNSLIGSFIGALADETAGSYGYNTKKSLQKAGQQMSLALFSKDMEREADYVGLYITRNSGYDISNAADLWRRLSLRDLKNKEAVVIADSHPTNPERFVALEKITDEITNKISNGEEILPTQKQLASNNNL